MNILYIKILVQEILFYLEAWKRDHSRKQNPIKNLMSVRNCSCMVTFPYFILDIIEGNYDSDPLLSIHLKNIPFASVRCLYY
jgi:hypothetical protein